MKRLGLAVVAMAAVSFMAGRAEAQLGVTTATLNATADIAAILEFDVLDDTINCGTIVVGQVTCDDGGLSPQAQLSVDANSDWVLIFTDGGGTGAANVATFSNGDAAKFGEFILDITSDAPDTSNGGTAGIDIIVNINGAFRGTTGTANEIVDVTDDNGAYAATFDVLLQATN